VTRNKFQVASFMGMTLKKYFIQKKVLNFELWFFAFCFAFLVYLAGQSTSTLVG